METLQEKEVQGHELLIALRNKVLALVSQSESEELLAEAMAILSGRSFLYSSACLFKTRLKIKPGIVK